MSARMGPSSGRSPACRSRGIARESRNTSPSRPRPEQTETYGTRAARGQGGGRPGQPGQEPVPRHDEPRDPNSAAWSDRIHIAFAKDRPQRRTAGDRREYRPEQPAAPISRLRCSGLVPHRGRPLALDLRDIDLRALVTDIGRSAELDARRRGLAFSCTIAEDVPTWVESDSLRIHQILGNLLGNALKFTHEGSVTSTSAARTHRMGRPRFFHRPGIPASA